MSRSRPRRCRATLSSPITFATCTRTFVACTTHSARGGRSGARTGRAPLPVAPGRDALHRGAALAFDVGQRVDHGPRPVRVAGLGAAPTRLSATDLKRPTRSGAQVSAVRPDRASWAPTDQPLMGTLVAGRRRAEDRILC